MRVAYFTDCYLPEINGVVTSIEAHTRILAERGHEILIIAPKYRKPILYVVPGVTIKRYRSFSWMSYEDVRVAIAPPGSLLRALSRFRPDVVHVQTPLTVGVVGVAVSSMLRLPIVETYHTYIPDFMRYVEPQKLLRLDRLQDRVLNSAVFERAFESELWQKMAEARENRKEVLAEAAEIARAALGDLVPEGRTEFPERFAWQFTRTVYNRADLVLTPSMTLKHELDAHGITVPVEHLSNGIDLALVRRKASYEPTGRLLHAGRLGAEKNVDVVIDAFARVLEDQPRCTLDVIGDGPAREQLEKRVKSLGLAGRVRMLGFMDRSALARAYCNYDAFVTASTIETQGIVLLEAMAAGLPVIGVDALAIPELVVDGRNGFVVAPGDPAALADAMRRMLAGHDLRERFGNACVADVQQHSLDSVVTRLEAIYARLAARER